VEKNPKTDMLYSMFYYKIKLCLCAQRCMVPGEKTHYKNIFQGYEVDTICYMLHKK